MYWAQFVLVYTPLYKTQAKDSTKQTPENSFSILVSNVLMDNDDTDAFLALVDRHNPDIILINETQLYQAFRFA
jgi:endonuclease/exonuclease/phosphatase (EEP) superfamily protein YafD